MRLIDAGALIDDIKNHLWDWETVNGITAEKVLKQTITDIENQPTVIQWTPTTKGLPKITRIHEDEDAIMHESPVCIVTTKDNRVTCAIFSHDVYKDPVELPSDCWIEEVTDRVLEVIAWMPLPEPYKE